MNTRQIPIFFRFSNVIHQFVWLFPCFVRVANPFVYLKLHLCYITLRIYRNQIKTKQFHVQCSVHKSYKTRKWTSSCIGNFEENMDLSRIYLAVLSSLQVNLFQKLATSAEHVVYQNCSECQKKAKKNNLCTQHVLQVFWAYNFHEKWTICRHIVG